MIPNDLWLEFKQKKQEEQMEILQSVLEEYVAEWLKGE